MAGGSFTGGTYHTDAQKKSLLDRKEKLEKRKNIYKKGSGWMSLFCLFATMELFGDTTGSWIPLIVVGIFAVPLLIFLFLVQRVEIKLKRIENTN